MLWYAIWIHTVSPATTYWLSTRRALEYRIAIIVSWMCGGGFDLKRKQRSGYHSGKASPCGIATIRYNPVISFMDFDIFQYIWFFQLDFFAIELLSGQRKPAVEPNTGWQRQSCICGRDPDERDGTVLKCVYSFLDTIQLFSFFQLHRWVRSDFAAEHTYMSPTALRDCTTHCLLSEKVIRVLIFIHLERFVWPTSNMLSIGFIPTTFFKTFSYYSTRRWFV